jgi:hypothetical protein
MMNERTAFKRKRKKSEHTQDKNPLYMVSNNGKDVEAVASFIELWIKKLGLESAFEMLKQMIELLLAQVTNYHMFTIVKAYIDELLNKVILVLSPVEAILNGHRNRRL